MKEYFMVNVIKVIINCTAGRNNENVFLELQWHVNELQRHVVYCWVHTSTFNQFGASLKRCYCFRVTRAVSSQQLDIIIQADVYSITRGTTYVHSYYLLQDQL